LNVLVTGCTGFIGANLTKRLLDEGYSVYGLIRLVSKRDLRTLEASLDRLRLIQGDLTQTHSVTSAVRAVRPQFVLHLGALTPVRASFQDQFPYIATNLVGTVNVVHAVLEEAPKARLIVASTAEVYGWQAKGKPISEDAPLNPASPYAVAKEAADQYVRMAMKVYDLQVTVLRPINTYGRKGESGYFVEYVVSSMMKGVTCYVGTPNSVRDYMFVDDHVNAYVTVMNSERAVEQVYNVSPGNPVTNREVAELIAKISGFEGKIVYGSYPPGYPQRPSIWDPEYLVLDSSKIRKHLGWKPSVTLEEGLRKTAESWRTEKAPCVL